MRKISVLVMARNDEEKIARPINIAGGLDEVLVLDIGSTDGRLSSVKQTGARLVSADLPGFPEQRRRAIEMARNDWCLLLDAEEELDDELRVSLSGFEPETGVSGYYIRRKNHFLGRTLSHGRWAKDRQLRLFTKTRTSVTDRQMQEGVVLEGRTKDWGQGSIINQTAPSLEKYLEKLNCCTTHESRQKTEEGKCFSLIKLVASPAKEFLRLYLWQGGFRDGTRGFALASLSALYKYALWVKIYQQQKASGEDLRGAQ